MSGIIGSAGSKSGIIGETEIDYEEGTWTPTLASGGCSGTSYYIKIGKSVTIYGEISHTSNGSGSSGVTINNPPFAIKHTTRFYGGAATNQSHNVLDANDTQGWFLMDAGNTMVMHGSPGFSGANASRWASGMKINFNCTYITT